MQYVSFCILEPAPPSDSLSSTTNITITSIFSSPPIMPSLSVSNIDPHFSESAHPSINSSIQPTNTNTVPTGVGVESFTLVVICFVVVLVLVLVPVCVLSTILAWVRFRKSEQRSLTKGNEQASNDMSGSLLPPSNSPESTISIHLRERRVWIIHDYNPFSAV